MYGYGYGGPRGGGYGGPRGYGYGAPPYTKQPMPYGAPPYEMGMMPPPLVPRDRYIEQYPPEPPNTGMLCGLGFLVLCCFAPPLGLVALCLAWGSTNAMQDGRIEEAHQCGRWSLWASMIGIILGVIGLIVGLSVRYA